MPIVLRPDQQQLQSEVFDAWRNGARHALAVLPTGGGKSVIVSDTVRQFDNNRQSTLVMAHRQELVGQMSLHVARQGIRHRIIAPKNIVSNIMALHRRKLNGQCFINPSARCAVAGVDTIVSRKTELAELLKQIELVVTDEAHHVLRKNKWGTAIALCSRAFGLGVTASPLRASGEGLGAHADGVFEFMGVGPSMRWLIDNRHLSDYEIVCPKTDFDVDGLKEGADGDYTNASMKAASEKSRIVGDIVEQYCINAWGKKTVAFVTDVATANKTADKFNAFGIPAMAISGNTDDLVRADAIARLEDGRLWVLVNVDLLGEGFDLPAIECVIMARPTASLSVYLQQFGRALRTLLGKLFGLVIDLVSNIKRHLFPDLPRMWTLDRREKRAKRLADPELVPVIVCTGCSKPYAAVHHACPFCGATVPPPLAGVGRGAIEVVMGDLTRLDAETLSRMRAATALASPEQKVSQAVYASGGMVNKQAMFDHQTGLHEAQSAVASALAEWAGYQRWKGRADDEIHMRFYHATGIDVLSALSAERTKQEFDTMAERIRTWLPKN